MGLLKNIVKENVLPLVLATGAEKILSAGSKGNTLNVMYHGVVKQNSLWFSPRHLTATEFDEHLAYFVKNYRIISQEEAFFNYRNGIQPKQKTISLSFDDGYLNNFTQALPIIEKYKIPVTFFVCGFIVEDPFPIGWSDLVALLYQQKDIPYLEPPGGKFERHPKHYFFNSEKQLGLFDYLKRLPILERDELLRFWTQKHDVQNRISQIDPEIWKMMNGEELQQFASSPYITIGSHGNKHYNLGLIEPEQARADIQESIRILESTLGKSINSIAYPDGSYNDEVKNIAQNCGIDMQLAVTYHMPSDLEDKRILARHGISNTVNSALNMVLVRNAFRKLAY